MDFWDILTYGAWLASGLLLLYIVTDAIAISRKYSEEFLLSSREGEDELLAGTEKKSSTDE